MNIFWYTVSVQIEKQSMTEVYLKEKFNSCYMCHESIMSRVAYSIFENTTNPYQAINWNCETELLSQASKETVASWSSNLYSVTKDIALL